MTQLLPALIEWQKDRKGFLFNTEASINLADNEDLMHTMVEAGFDTVFIGIETPDEESLAECNKKQNKNRNLIESVKSIQRTGLQVQGGFIVGFDSDGPSIFQNQIDFIQKILRRDTPVGCSAGIIDRQTHQTVLFIHL